MSQEKTSVPGMENSYYAIELPPSKAIAFSNP